MSPCHPRLVVGLGWGDRLEQLAAAVAPGRDPRMRVVSDDKRAIQAALPAWHTPQWPDDCSGFGPAAARQGPARGAALRGDRLPAGDGGTPPDGPGARRARADAGRPG